MSRGRNRYQAQIPGRPIVPGSNQRESAPMNTRQAVRAGLIAQPERDPYMSEVDWLGLVGGANDDTDSNLLYWDSARLPPVRVTTTGRVFSDQQVLTGWARRNSSAIARIMSEGVEQDFSLIDEAMRRAAEAAVRQVDRELASMGQAPARAVDVEAMSAQDRIRGMSVLDRLRNPQGATVRNYMQMIRSTPVNLQGFYEALNNAAVSSRLLNQALVQTTERIGEEIGGQIEQPERMTSDRLFRGSLDSLRFTLGARHRTPISGVQRWEARSILSLPMASWLMARLAELSPELRNGFVARYQGPHYVANSVRIVPTPAMISIIQLKVRVAQSWISEANDTYGIDAALHLTGMDLNQWLQHKDIHSITAYRLIARAGTIEIEFINRSIDGAETVRNFTNAIKAFVKNTFRRLVRPEETYMHVTIVVPMQALRAAYPATSRESGLAARFARNALSYVQHISQQFRISFVRADGNSEEATIVFDCPDTMYDAVQLHLEEYVAVVRSIARSPVPSAPITPNEVSYAAGGPGAGGSPGGEPAHHGGAGGNYVVGGLMIPEERQWSREYVTTHVLPGENHYDLRVVQQADTVSVASFDGISRVVRSSPETYVVSIRIPYEFFHGMRNTQGLEGITEPLRRYVNDELAGEVVLTRLEYELHYQTRDVNFGIEFHRPPGATITNRAELGRMIDSTLREAVRMASQRDGNWRIPAVEQVVRWGSIVEIDIDPSRYHSVLSGFSDMPTWYTVTRNDTPTPLHIAFVDAPMSEKERTKVLTAYNIGYHRARSALNEGHHALLDCLHRVLRHAAMSGKLPVCLLTGDAYPRITGPHIDKLEGWFVDCAVYHTRGSAADKRALEKDMAFYDMSSPDAGKVISRKMRTTLGVARTQVVGKYGDTETLTQDNRETTNRQPKTATRMTLRRKD